MATGNGFQMRMFLPWRTRAKYYLSKKEGMATSSSLSSMEIWLGASVLVPALGHRAAGEESISAPPGIVEAELRHSTSRRRPHSIVANVPMGSAGWQPVELVDQEAGLADQGEVLVGLVVVGIWTI